MYKFVPDFFQYMRRVEALSLWQLEDRGVYGLPCSSCGGFEPEDVADAISFVRLNSEYHIVSCLSEDLVVNFFVEDAVIYYLGEGDSDPHLVFDRRGVFDCSLLYTWSSGRSKRRA